jgi:hypothetical protein
MSEVMLILRSGLGQPVARLEWTLAARVLAVRIDALTHREAKRARGASQQAVTLSRSAFRIATSGRVVSDGAASCRILFGCCGQLIACAYRAIGKEACGRPARPQDRGMRRFLVAETAG